MVIESTENPTGVKITKRNFIQGGVRNANERVYPVKRLEGLSTPMITGYPVPGEVGSSEGPKLIRSPHMMTNMWMEEKNGYGK